MRGVRYGVVGLLAGALLVGCGESETTDTDDPSPEDASKQAEDMLNEGADKAKDAVDDAADAAKDAVDDATGN